MSLLDRFRSWRLRRRVKKGKQSWGRQAPQGGGTKVRVPMAGHAEVTARVYREATGEWEDLGVVSEYDYDLREGE